MSKTTITVAGAADAHLPAELATVSLTVGFEGPLREPVFQAATEAANALTAGIRDLHDPTKGPVLSWSSDQLRVWASRPWHSEGKQLPLVQHATLGLTVEFSDFDALARWLDATAELDGVSIGGIEWSLREPTRDAALEDVRTRAVQDAVAKARVYAAALGLTEVAARSISEPSTYGGHERMMVAAMDVGSAGGGLEFTPDELEVRAEVQATFAAS